MGVSPMASSGRNMGETPVPRLERKPGSLNLNPDA